MGRTGQIGDGWKKRPALKRDGAIDGLPGMGVTERQQHLSCQRNKRQHDKLRSAPQAQHPASPIPVGRYNTKRALKAQKWPDRLLVADWGARLQENGLGQLKPR